MLFQDRADAGRQLAVPLNKFAHVPEVLILALPRGGVPVGFEVAQALGAPLDVFLVRKLGVPGHEELAMGAIASGGCRVLNDELVDSGVIPAGVIDAVAAEEERELRLREQLYRDDRPPPDVRDRTVIVLDDGVATGSSMRAAVTALKVMAPARIVVAIPVGAAETCAELERHADEVVCVVMPDRFYAVGEWYRDFEQVSDDEVRTLLARAEEVPRAGAVAS